MSSLNGKVWEKHREATGNMSLILLIDPSEVSASSLLGCRPQSSMFPAFEHFGIPYQIFDLRKNDLLRSDVLSRSCIVIGQEKLGKLLSGKEVDVLMNAVHEGVGLVNFDGSISRYPLPFKEALGMQGETPTHKTTSLRVCNNTH